MQVTMLLICSITAVGLATLSDVMHLGSTMAQFMAPE